MKKVPPTHRSEFSVSEKPDLSLWRYEWVDVRRIVVLNAKQSHAAA
jgi:hypothetical protein